MTLNDLERVMAVNLPYFTELGVKVVEDIPKVSATEM